MDRKGITNALTHAQTTTRSTIVEAKDAAFDFTRYRELSKKPKPECSPEHFVACYLINRELYYVSNESGCGVLHREGYPTNKTNKMHKMVLFSLGIGIDTSNVFEESDDLYKAAQMLGVSLTNAGTLKL